jgi:RNA polymerase sigma factor (sigma-70 family)
MNKELDVLAEEYIKTKDKNILDKIFKILKNLLKKKASFVFYNQTFHEGRIIRYKTIQPENKKIPIHEYNFKLSETGQTELKDVEQELALEVIRILNKYNPKQSFETYLISALWLWTPKFARKNKFFNYFKNNSMNVIDDNGNEKSLIDELPQETNHYNDKLEELFENLTETEKKIINLFQENSNINQSQIAGIIGITKQRVSFILKGLKKKYVD